MLPVDILMKAIIENINTILRLLKCGVRCKICLGLFVCTCYALWQIFSSDPIEKLMKQTNHNDTLISVLPKLVNEHFIQLLYGVSNEDSAKFDFDVETLIYRLAKNRYKFKAIIATVNEYPATVWRLSDREAENEVIFRDKSITRKSMLLARKKFIQNTIQMNRENIVYYSVYETKENVSNIEIFEQNLLIYKNILYGKKQKSIMKFGLYYFIFLKDNVYVFTEYGGTQIHNDNVPNINPKVLSYSKFKYKDFIHTKYRMFIENELGHKLNDIN